MPVPPSFTQVRIPAGKLAELPAGAGYSSRSGQATVNLTRLENGDVLATATCDSLARVVIRLQEELERIRGTSEVREKPPVVVHEPTGWQWFWIRTGQALSVGLLAGLALRYLRMRFKR